ncbi:MAG: hypothetical protein WA919_29425 [Coleofasciculaceae cyanobacterium]
MNAVITTTTSSFTSSEQNSAPDNLEKTDSFVLREQLLSELKEKVGSLPGTAKDVVKRIAIEVERICRLSDRIQNSGEVNSWQLNLGRQRLQKCLKYYDLGAVQGRVELHSCLSMIVYRHVARAKSHLGFNGRCQLIEEFLQDFYADSLKIFRREHPVAADYTPRTRFQLAEYMAFTEQYAKRRISLRHCGNQPLIVLRAKSFATRQPKETTIDFEQALELSKDDLGSDAPSPFTPQLREHLVAKTTDPHEGILRERVIQELIQYLQQQGHNDCADYLTLKLQDLPAQEIDDILGMTSKERDYLQQRFKYHLEKFAHASNWQLVHQWLGAGLEQRLGLSSQQWQLFVEQLDASQKRLLQLKQEGKSDAEIAKALKLTPKKMQKRWSELLTLAAKIRNSEVIDSAA